MPKSNSLSRVKRIVKLLGMLQGGKGRNAAELAQACEVTPRTIFRDLETLRRVEVPIELDPDQQTYCIPEQHFLPPTNFTPDEALAVLVLCHELGSNARLPFWRPARDAALKLENALPAALVREVLQARSSIHINVDATNRLDGQKSTYDQLVDAVARLRPVRLSYHSFMERAKVQTRLHPYKLLFSQHSWYVIGHSALHNEVRTFNVGRIESLELLDERFSIPIDFTLEGYLRNAWRLIPEPGPDQEVVLHFQSQVARNVREVAWHRTQRATLLPDGSLEFRVTVSGLKEISWWILGYGDQVTVVSPEPLRELIRARAQRMTELYS